MQPLPLVLTDINDYMYLTLLKHPNVLDVGLPPVDLPLYLLNMMHGNVEIHEVEFWVFQKQQYIWQNVYEG